MIRKLAIGVLGTLGVLGVAGADDAAANGAGAIGGGPRRQRKPKCGSNQRRCGNDCCPKCRGNQRPCGKRCCPKKCPAGRPRCGSKCCPKGQVCRGGTCVKRQTPPNCTPIARDVACEGRECGTASDGCNGQYTCGSCEGQNESCNEQTGQCVCTPPQSQEQACAGRDCGTVPDGCDGDYNCGTAPGSCPPVACQTAIACNNQTGQCIYEADPELQGESCSISAGIGMCVAGVCEVTNPNGICTGRSACDDPNQVGFCNSSGTCVCYSTVEGAGFCIDRSQAQCPPVVQRAQCTASTDCEGNEVCVSLDQGGSSCCGSGGPYPGFCVPLAARCSNAD